MCGIAGLFNCTSFEKVSKKDLKKMTDAIAHRGPDGEGHWFESNVGLGHRRLAIIDRTKQGAQPMISLDRRYVLSYNGEIYNFKELRKELKKLNYRFLSNSDTEVVLYSLIEWGVEALIKFNGMFAFAFYDRKNKTLLLARDRYGIKPLYVSNQNGNIYFGSEQKAILSIDKFKKKLNKNTLLEYFTFQNIFTDQTFFQDINLIPPGCYIKIEHNKFPKLNWTRYWDFNFHEENIKLSKNEYVEETERLFRQAVTRQLVSDVEVGAYLSGGIDSGSITRIASETLPGIKTFTCGFDLTSASGLELSFDERKNAEIMSARFNTEQYEIVLKHGDMERCISDLAFHIEDPRVGQSYPNYYASKLASKFVKVVLSGSGGDEIFGGYPWRYYKVFDSNNYDDYISKYYKYWQRLVSNKEIKKIFSPIWTDVKDVWTEDIFKNVFVKNNKTIKNRQDYINNSLYFEAKTFLHGLLVVEDKISMSFGLEQRVPFLDNDLVDFSMKCPLKYKLDINKSEANINENDFKKKYDSSHIKTNNGKIILKEAMKKYIPNEIYKSNKQGFSAPDSSWFRGDSIEYVKKNLLDKNANIYTLLDFNEVKTIINEHLTGKNNRRLFIWSLLNTEEWLKNFFNDKSFN
jgi:asparagine synthase (glutamine-hydrolysing)